MNIFEQLAQPFPVNEVHWRVGSVSKKNTKRGTALAYIDARHVMERLDTTVGPEGWQCRYSLLGATTVCEIGIRINDEWIWKADGAGESNFEAQKGALSDAFKRAGVKWGIGRYLYDLHAPWVEINEWKQIAETEMDKLRQILRRVSEGTAMPEQPSGQVAVKTAYASRKEARWGEVESAVRNSTSVDMLDEAVKSAYADLIASWPEGWRGELRSIYAEKREELKEKEAA